METPATYTATPSSTSAGELLSQIQTIIDERDAYKAKCERQGHILAKLADLMGDLQVFIDEVPTDNETEAATSTPIHTTPAPRSSGRRYTDDDVMQWVSALRAGKSQRDISIEYDVSARTIYKRARELGFDPATGMPLESDPLPGPEAETASEPKPPAGDDFAATTSSPAAPLTLAVDENLVLYGDDTIAEWSRLLDAGRSAEWIGDKYGVSQYRVTAMVRMWREEHSQVPAA